MCVNNPSHNSWKKSLWYFGITSSSELDSSPIRSSIRPRFASLILPVQGYSLTHWTWNIFNLFIITFMIRKNSFGRTDNLTRHSFFHSFLFCFIQNYSHSVVPGGFEVKSYNTRVIPGTFKNILRIEIASFDGSKMENTKMVEFMKRLQSQRFPSSIYRSSTLESND